MIELFDRVSGRAGLVATVFAGLHFVAIASPAYAQQPVAGQPPPPTPPSPVPAGVGAPVAGGGDVVVLKSGGMLQGTLIDAIPGSHARIQLRTGEIATVRWSEIDHIERTQGGGPGPATAPPSAPVAPAPAAYAPGGATANVHIDSEATVELQYLKPTGEWITACVSPCDRAIGVDGEYRITGSGVRTTPSFHIAAQQGQKVVLQVSPRNGAARGLGIAGIAVGGLGLLIGLVVIAVGASETTVNSVDNAAGVGGTSDGGGTEAAGFGISIASALLIAGGIVLVVGNSRTTVEQSTYDADAQPPPPQAKLPAWREVGSSVPRAPAAAALPLFSGTF